MAWHRPQDRIDTYFQSRSSYWNDVYGDGDVQSAIYQDRQEAAIGWIDDLALGADARALDIGCGAGFMTVALAERGFRVDAVDTVPVMVEMTRQRTRTMAARVAPTVGDVCSLRFDDGTFDLVVALGLIPWLERPERAIREMARVTRAGGHVLVTADNLLRLNHLLDPYLHPALRPLKRRLKTLLHQRGIGTRFAEAAPATYHAPWAIDETLADAGLVKITSHTLGFGPFTLFAHQVLPEPRATVVHRHLQSLADRRLPVVRSMGAHYLVLAEKRGGAAPA